MLKPVKNLEITQNIGIFKYMKKTNIMKNLKLHLLTERVRLLTSFERLLKSNTP